MTQLANVMLLPDLPNGATAAEAPAEGAPIIGTPFPELLLKAALGRLPTEALPDAGAEPPTSEEVPEEAALLVPTDAAAQDEVALPFLRAAAPTTGLPEVVSAEAPPAETRGTATESSPATALRTALPPGGSRGEPVATPVPDASPTPPAVADTATRDVPRTSVEIAAATPQPTREEASELRTSPNGAAVAEAAGSAQRDAGDAGDRRDDAQRSQTPEPALPEATNRDASIRAGQPHEAFRSADGSAATSPPPTAPNPAQAQAVATPSFEAVVPVTPPTPQTAAAPPPAGSPAEVVPVHAEWLTQRGGGTARLRLHPPELGEMELSVRVRGNAVDVVIRAREPAAQLAAAQSRDLLVEGLAQRDLRVDQFEVRGDDRSDPRGQDAADLRDRRDASNGDTDSNGRRHAASDDEGSRALQSRLLVTNDAPHARRPNTAVDLRA